MHHVKSLRWFASTLALFAAVQIATVQTVRAQSAPTDYRDEFLLLRDVFGRARMEPASFYAAGFADHGLDIEADIDITAETFATFARWRENSESHRERVCELIGQARWQQFVDACAVLERFWEDGVLGYGIIAAAKP